MGRFPLIDLHGLAAEANVDLDAALSQLRAIYADVDARNAKNTAGLDLPCQRGCSACCEEVVFLSPIEFLGIWQYAQANLTDDVRDAIVDDGLRIYAQHRDAIDALGRRPAPGQQSHVSLMRNLAWRCPYLDDGGACRVYPVREIYARLFGCSFNDARCVYGCDLVGKHLAGQTLTLIKARPAAERVLQLPLSGLQQVHPWYLHWLYGAEASTPSSV